MISRPTRALAWLPLLFVPLVAFAGSGLGCELLVDVDTMLVDGSPNDVVIPMSLDGYQCPICTDVSPEAQFDGDEFTAPHSKDAGAEGGTEGGSGPEASPTEGSVPEAANESGPG